MSAPDPSDLDALAEAYERGLDRERAGDLAGAVDAFRAALALDPADRGGVALRLAALGAAPSPEIAPPAYVATLFDQTAERFDDILVEQLGYSVPLTMREALASRPLPQGARMLDLGCGTGLAGLAMADRVGEITGVDLSEAMLGEAHDRGCYADLYVGDAAAFLAGQAPGDPLYDLVVATDMLPYLGALEELFAGAYRCLAPGGWLAVSSERLAEDAPEATTPGYAVGPGHRFAHGAEYLRRALAGAGFRVDTLDPIVVRYNEGHPVPGHLAIARKA